MPRLGKRSSALLVVGVVMLAVTGTGVGLAVNGDGDVVHACAKKENGQLRVVDSADDCRASEDPISLSSVDTPVRYYTAGVNTGVGGGGGDPLEPGERRSLHVFCEPGDVATGGGVSVSGNGIIKTSSPGVDFPDPTPVAWIAVAENPGPGTAGMGVSVNCADLTP